ncbi:FGGY-family carbohydrate kinase [Paenibacillus sp. Dod16]
MAIAGIDIGTTGCKCTVYDQKGQLLSEVYKEYCSAPSNKHLLDASLIWQYTKSVLQEAAKQANELLDAIGVTSFGEAAIWLDQQMVPMAPSMLYAAPYGKEQCDRLIRHFGRQYLNQSTGLAPTPMYSLPKLMYFAEHNPELVKEARAICLFADFIVYMLSGVRQIDYSLASRTMALDINSLEWNHEILTFAGIEPNLFPVPVPIGSIAGKILSSLAEELGIHPEAMIVSGCHDQIAAAIGTGAYQPGMAVDGTGTVECITPVLGQEIVKESLYKGGYAIVPFLNSRYVTYAYSLTGGALLKWYRDNLAYCEANEARKQGDNPYEVFNSEVDASKPSGLLVLPHFSGAGTPYTDPESRGAIFGLTTETTSREIYQALMEGVTFEMALNLERLSEAGIEIHTLLATGGGALSHIWLQMKADILNRPIVSLGAAQSGTLGCIMLAGVACGIYSSLEDAESVYVKVRHTYTPDSGKHEHYNKWYNKYKKCYEAVKSVMTVDQEV